jgi:pyruvate/2-oxoglutarate dehydrogenase complex dihydrolipoamide acyltransferase (E2) component
MITAITLPDLGLAPGQPIRLSVWLAAPGERVYEGDRLVEVVLPGATFDVPATATGTLAECLAHPDEAIYPGQVLGWVEGARPG